METETAVPEAVPMPDPDSIATESVDTSTAFGAPSPLGRDAEERIAELEDDRRRRAQP